MTALAQFLNRLGKKVTGSDTTEKFFTDEILKKEKIKFFENFSKENLPKNLDLLIYSDAYSKENPEIQNALSKKIPILSYAEALGLISFSKHTIAVSGSHGKTTTTALLGFVMKELGLDPSVIVGSQVIQFEGNALLGKSKYLILEADEYKAHLLKLNPRDIILTSLDYDHPDFYPTPQSYHETFKKFIEKLEPESFLVACTDDQYLKKILPATKAKIIEVTKKELQNLHFETHLIGEHNQLNILAVFKYLKTAFNIGDEKIKKAIAKFLGTKRRFEKIGEYKSALIFDDYAHHPTEIKVTLEAIRAKFPDKKIWCVFHPHTYSRTTAFFHDFARSFQNADEVILLEIYASAREKEKTTSSKKLVAAIQKYQSQARFLSTHKEVIAFLKDKLGPQDLVVTMGAGDVWKIAQALTQKND